MPAIVMLHDKDPRIVTHGWADPVANKITIPGAWILMAVYRRPERTAGGILLTGKNRDEDNYQGVIGLVLKLGPIAFAEDGSHVWGGVTAKVNDWVIFRVGDTFGLDVPGNEKRTLRFIEDVNIKGIIEEPDIVA